MTNDPLHQLVLRRFRVLRRYCGVVRPSPSRRFQGRGFKDFHPWARWLRGWGPTDERPDGVLPGWTALNPIWLLPSLGERCQWIERRLEVTLSGHFSLSFLPPWRLTDSARHPQFPAGIETAAGSPWRAASGFTKQVGSPRNARELPRGAPLVFHPLATRARAPRRPPGDCVTISILRATDCAPASIGSAGAPAGRRESLWRLLLLIQRPYQTLSPTDRRGTEVGVVLQSIGSSRTVQEHPSRLWRFPAQTLPKWRDLPPSKKGGRERFRTGLRHAVGEIPPNLLLPKGGTQRPPGMVISGNRLKTVTGWLSALANVVPDHPRRILAELRVTRRPPVSLARSRHPGPVEGFRERMTRLGRSLPARLRTGREDETGTASPQRFGTAHSVMPVHEVHRSNQDSMELAPRARIAPDRRTTDAATAAPYVYRRTGGAGMDGEITATIAGGSTLTGVGARLDSRIEGLVRDNLEQWGRKHLNPRRIADEAYRTLVRQLGRERERLGR